MTGIKDLNDLDRGFVSLTAGDIPEALRSKGLIGGTRKERTDRNWRDDCGMVTRRGRTMDHKRCIL
jgi:hypothetical protein